MSILPTVLYTGNNYAPTIKHLFGLKQTVKITRVVISAWRFKVSVIKKKKNSDFNNDEAATKLCD